MGYLFIVLPIVGALIAGRMQTVRRLGELSEYSWVDALKMIFETCADSPAPAIVGAVVGLGIAGLLEAMFQRKPRQ